MGKKNILNKILVLALVTGFSHASWAKIEVVRESEVPANCQSMGYFHGSAGYGKTMDGERVALAKALQAAESAGACHAVIKELNRGTSDLGGYARVEGFGLCCADSK